jgi:hypothetical protein
VLAFKIGRPDRKSSLPSRPDLGNLGGSRKTKSNNLSWAHPAYGGVEVLQLNTLYHPEEVFEKKSRNRNDGWKVEAGGHVLACNLGPLEGAAQSSFT